MWLLSSVGMLNQQALYLTKVCVRFYLKHANDANTKNLKDFLEFVKAGDFCMRINGQLLATCFVCCVCPCSDLQLMPFAASGVRVELADAWKLVAVASSFFFTLLQMQTKGNS
jgi:hypothetical protein